MILADASVWIAHFRSPNEEFQAWLEDGSVLMHPFVLGELELGNIPDRRRTLASLNELSESPEATHAEALKLLRAHDLSAKGIGYVDLRLLASVRIRPGVNLWTRDQRLGRLAQMLGVGFSPLGNA